ncbi:MAG TPA: hypothetical protein VLM37_11190 [Fibrobacteraceae bacterium]|nr:hypothetical protein [Fibrobacteraceae bacterium]
MRLFPILLLLMTAFSYAESTDTSIQEYPVRMSGQTFFIEVSANEHFALCPGPVLDWGPLARLQNGPSLHLGAHNCFVAQSPAPVEPQSLPLIVASGTQSHPRQDTVWVLVHQKLVDFGGRKLIVDRTDLTVRDLRGLEKWGAKILHWNRHDTAADKPFSGAAQEWTIANARSQREGLQPVFRQVPVSDPTIQQFPYLTRNSTEVLIMDTSASGYRFAFLDEWKTLCPGTPNKICNPEKNGQERLLQPGAVPGKWIISVAGKSKASTPPGIRLVRKNP